MGRSRCAPLREGSGRVARRLRASRKGWCEMFTLLRGANPAPTRAALWGGPQEAVAAGSVPLERLVWITAPTRHYKLVPGVGRVECPDGNETACRACTGSWQSHDAPQEVDWVVDDLPGVRVRTWPAPRALFPRRTERGGRLPAQMLRLWGTLDRRRRLNELAREMVGAAFAAAAPHVALSFVDYQALTEALPADYSMDGTRARALSPFAVAR